MTKDQADTLSTLLHIQRCVDELVAGRPIGNLDNARRELRDLIAKMNTNAAKQVSATIGSQMLTQQKLARRNRLVRNMRAISRIAACDLGTSPEFKVFEMPRREASNEQLANVAHEMAHAAEPYIADFVNAGLPLDFVEQVHLAAQQLIESQAVRDETQHIRAGATAAMEALSRHARNIVGVLDALINVAFQSDPSQLIKWTMVKHPHRPAAA